MEEVTHSLADLMVYLDITSLKNLSASSHLLHKLVNPHISSNTYFTFYSQPTPTTIQNYFKVYKPKMLHLMFPLVWDEEKAFHFKALPMYLTHLKFGNICSDFPGNLKLSIPETLKYLSVNLNIQAYSLQLKVVGVMLKYLPNSISKISLLNNKIPTNMFPTNLTHLQMSKFTPKVYFDVEKLPRTLTYIAFYNSFDHSVDNLPSGLTHLYFGSDFNQPVDNLPTSLLVVKFGSKFNQNIDLLPPFVKHISLKSIDYDTPITKLPNVHTFQFYSDKISSISLPQSLKKLAVWRARKVSPIDLTAPQIPQIKSDLPQEFHFGVCFGDAYFLFPGSLRIFEIVNYVGRSNSFPRSLTSLKCIWCKIVDVHNLPPSLVKLELTHTEVLHHSLDYLPKNLTHLEVNTLENELVDYLPLSLTHLILKSNCTKPLDHLPPNLTHLRIEGSLSCVFTQPLDHLPSSLIMLSVCTGLFNQPLDHLPNSLKYLFLYDNAYDQNLDHLPPSLIYLSLPREYGKPLDNLPASLTFLHLPWCKVPLDHLPESLFHLFCDFGDEDLHYLPPHCTVHPISHWNNFLPTSLSKF